MRVVAGTAGGRRLVAPAGRDTRPTSDRVREAVFNSLESMDAVEGARVLDLFAGSGALGIEALSRGAAHATFVDRDREAIAAIRTNLDTLGLADRADVVTGDALGHLSVPTEPKPRRIAHTSVSSPSRVRYDLVLLDPPYAFDEWAGLFAALPPAIVVAESDRHIDPGDGWDVVRQKRYGTTLVTIIRPQSGHVPRELPQ